MSGRWSRRGVLAAVAGGLTAAACGHARPRGHTTTAASASTSASSAAASGTGLPIAIKGLTSKDLASFAAFTGGAVDPVPDGGPGPSTGARATPARWQIAGAFPFDQPAPGQYAAVDTALRQVNFRTSMLLPGTLDAFAGTDGNHYAIPAYMRPWGVRYDPAVFRLVGLTDPAPDWTIDDFEKCCTLIAVAIARGTAPHLRSVLPQLVGTTTLPGLAGAKLLAPPQYGGYMEPALWGAFVLGFGGTVVTGGRFDLGNPGAVDGLQRMADIAARFGPSASVSVPGASAMSFAPAADALDPAVTRGTGVRWARFPVLPVQAVVPAVVGGFTVASVGTIFSLRGSDPGAPPGALVALAEYSQWWYQRDRTTPGLAGLPPPVLADAAVQEAYWQGKQRPAGFAAVGDWQRFTVVGTGWPLVPHAYGTTVWYQGEPTSPVYDALTSAVQNKVPVSGLVAQAAQKLNAMVDSGKPRASKSASGPAGGG